MSKNIPTPYKSLVLANGRKRPFPYGKEVSVRAESILVLLVLIVESAINEMETTILKTEILHIF